MDKSKVSKAALLLDMLAEIFVCLAFFLLVAVLSDAGFRQFALLLCGIIVLYFIARNYFFVSVGSAAVGIRWKKNKFILLKNCIYISLIIVLLIQKIIFIRILAGLAINSDIVFMLIKGRWFLDILFRIECCKSRG